MSPNPVFFKIVVTKLNPALPTTIEAEILARHDGTYERLIPTITSSELDGYIDLLKEELEWIRREGKKRFAVEERKLSQHG